MKIETNQGPWVSRFGAHLVATEEDITVWIDGVRVRPDRIDPYGGIVWVPGPVRSGALIEVEAITVPHAVLPFVVGSGRTGQVGTPIGPAGVRGHYTIRIGMGPRPNPVRIAHRYWAADRARSSLLGDPVGLRTGRVVSTSPPTSLRGPVVRAKVSLLPDSFWAVWSKRGPGQIGVTPEGVGTSGSVLACTALPVRAGSDSFISGRVQVGREADRDGFWAELGLHDGSVELRGGVYQAGSCRHLAIRGDRTEPELFPRIEAHAVQPDLIEIDSLVGSGQVQAGWRFQIQTGPQRGTYRIRSTSVTELIRTRLQIDPPLPARLDQEGGRNLVGFVDIGTDPVWILQGRVGPGGAELACVSTGRALVRIGLGQLPTLRGLTRLEGIGDPFARGAGFFGSDLPARWGAVGAESSGSRQPDRVTPLESNLPGSLPRTDWIEAPPVQILPGPTLQGLGGPSPAGLGFLSPLQQTGQVVSVRGVVSIQGGSGTGDFWWEVSDGVRSFVVGSVLQVGTDLWRPDGASLVAGIDPEQSGFDLQGDLTPTPTGFGTESFLVGRIPLPEGVPIRATLQVSRGVVQIGSPQYGVRIRIEPGVVQIETAAGVSKQLLGSGQIELVCSEGSALIGLFGGAVILSGSELAGPMSPDSSMMFEIPPGEQIGQVSCFVTPPVGATRRVGILLDPTRPYDLSRWVFPEVPIDLTVPTALRVILDPAWGCGLLRTGSGPGWYSDRLNQNELDPACPYRDLAQTETPPGILIGVGPNSFGRVRYEQTSVRIVARDVPGEVGVLRESSIGRAGFETSGEESQVGRFEIRAESGLIEPHRWGLRIRQVVAVQVGPNRYEPQIQSGQIRLPSPVENWSGPVFLFATLQAITHPEQLQAFPVRGAPTELSEQTPPIFPDWFSSPTRQDRADPDSAGHSAQFDPLDPDRNLLPLARVTQRDQGRTGLIWIASDDPTDLPWWGQSEDPDPDWTLEGEEWTETYRVRSDGTERGQARLAGLFRPRGGPHPGTPTMDKRGRDPLYVVAPAQILPLIEILS